MWGQCPYLPMELHNYCFAVSNTITSLSLLSSTTTRYLVCYRCYSSMFVLRRNSHRRNSHASFPAALGGRVLSIASTKGKHGCECTPSSAAAAPPPLWRRGFHRFVDD